jgi:spermidine synthase
MWIHIDSDSSNGNQLDLYERNGLYMIRANGWELMNGEYHASEDQLGRLAGLLARAPRPKILVGGLGLGYTLASLLETLGQRRTEASITVAERSGAVLRWFDSHISPRLLATRPPGARLVESDVANHLGAHRRWNVIVLDVDNGPEALSTPGNAMLYGEHGLARCRDSLTPSGHLLLWAGFEDPSFVHRARAAGFSATKQTVPFPVRSDQAHVLYVLSRQPISMADRERLGLVTSGCNPGGRRPAVPIHPPPSTPSTSAP